MISSFSFTLRCEMRTTQNHFPTYLLQIQFLTVIMKKYAHPTLSFFLALRNNHNTQQLLLRIHEQWMINGLILTHFSIIWPNTTVRKTKTRKLNQPGGNCSYWNSSTLKLRHTMFQKLQILFKKIA